MEQAATNRQGKMSNASNILAGAVANFSAISFGIGVFENDATGVVAGVYSLFFAVTIAWEADR